MVPNVQVAYADGQSHNVDDFSDHNLESLPPSPTNVIVHGALTEHQFWLVSELLATNREVTLELRSWSHDPEIPDLEFLAMMPHLR